MQTKLPSFRVSGDVSGETNGRRTLAGGELTPRHKVVDVLQQLRLAGAGISTKQDVDVGTEVAPALRVEFLLRATEQLQQNALFDVFIFINVGSQSMGHPLVNVILLRQLFQLPNSLLRKCMVFAANINLLFSSTN